MRKKIIDNPERDKSNKRIREVKHNENRSLDVLSLLDTKNINKISKQSYLNISKRKNKEAKVASMVRHFSKDFFNINSNNKYINFSIHDNVGEDNVAVVLMVRHSPDERDLLQRRIPGSIPGPWRFPCFS